MHALAYVGLAVVFLLGSLPRSATADQVSVNLPHVQVHLLVLDIFAFGTLLIWVFFQRLPSTLDSFCFTHSAWKVKQV